ncbi:FHA domain-containing protein [Chloroflexota bacterium]
MSDDRTTPMRQPQWSQGGSGSDDQETVYADQGGVTPPTVPLGDQGFQRTSPPGGVRPQEPGGPLGPAPYQVPDVPEGGTMIISERPTPVFAWLVVVDGPGKSEIGRVHTLKPDTTTLGRVQGNDVVLHDETCSAQHARIRLEAQEDKESAHVLYDMGSRNGTYVGDKDNYREEDRKSYRHELVDGDYLLAGETTLVFKKL